MAEIDAHNITKINLASVQSNLQTEMNERIKLEKMVNDQQGKLQSQDALILEQSIKTNRFEKILNETRLQQRINSCAHEVVKMLSVIVIAGIFFFSIKKK